MTATEWNSERASWLPVALWSHGRELAFVISYLLDASHGQTPTQEHAVLGLLAQIRGEWNRSVDSDAKLPQLPQLGAFVAPNGRLALLVHR